ncbi:DUF6263 family protein [Zhouia sp. PK063]|uniref:DUF6263 family protein n=1 Tax=Zhouia sp. PK063 TaxID=3373602 RepID=UPI00379B23CD
MKKVVSIIVILCSVTLSYAQKVKLELNLKKGEEYMQMMNMTSGISQEFQGQKMQVTVQLKGALSYVVTDVTAEGFQMDVTYKQLSIDMKIPMAQKEMSYSSEKNDSTDVMSSLLKGMTGTAFQVLLSKTGKVLSVQNLDKLFQKNLKSISNLPADQLAQFKGQLESSYGKESFKGNFEMITNIYPEEKVKVGDQWQIENNLQSGFVGNLNSTYSLATIEKDYYEIKGEGSIKTDKSTSLLETDGNMQIDLNGKVLSDIKIDKKSGWILDATLQQTIDGAFTMGVPMGDAKGMSIPVHINNTIEYTDK